MGGIHIKLCSLFNLCNQSVGGFISDLYTHIHTHLSNHLLDLMHTNEV